MDPGQIQQVLLTLFGRVADIPRPGPASRRLEIRTFNEARKRAVGIEISSVWTGAPELGEDDPGEESEGRELGTVRRIVERHQGRLEVVEGSSTGDTYRLLLPAA
jgi:hypothetical protein